MELGEFIEKKRKDMNISLRSFASMVGITATYLSDIEKGYRNPSDNVELLKKIAKTLQLSIDESRALYDMAAKHNADHVPLDIAEYITEFDVISDVIRIAKDYNVAGYDWQYFINYIIDKYGYKSQYDK